jgi:hypothetical protein
MMKKSKRILSMGYAVALAVAMTGVAVADGEDPPPTCEGDVVPNGEVDVVDLIVLLAQWGPVPPTRADINQDGFVDVNDLLIVLENWGPCE